MGYYREYLDRKLSPPELESERKAELKRIGELLEANVLTYAARMAPLPMQLPIGVEYEDLLPFLDLLDGMQGDRIAIILETPGGSGEVGREMVENLHERFKHVMFIVPGWAKSTGTIMAMGGHEIMMWTGSSLGPIDAQIQWEGKVFSADALLEGLNTIKEEVETSGKLNPAYIPILQRISPGEIQNAQNALEFARKTVGDWLCRYKFRDWDRHSSTGKDVTPEDRQARAYEIAEELSSQSRWFTHGRSLRIADLKELRLQIRELELEPQLLEAVRRYQVLLRMSFDQSNMFKVFETVDQRVVRNFNIQAAVQLPGAKVPLMPGAGGAHAHVDVACNSCGSKFVVQADLDPGVPLQAGALRLPRSGVVACPQCGSQLNLTPLIAQVEQQAGRPIVFPEPEE